MRKVNMHEAKSTLSELVRLALLGEDVVLARHGEPVVRLVPFQLASGLRPIGLHRLPAHDVSQEFLDESLRPLSAAELESWSAPVLPDKDLA